MSIAFDIVPDTLREEALGTNRLERNPNPLTKALTDGKTVFIGEEAGEKINTLYDAARRRGFKFHARKVVLEDKTGFLGWFEVKVVDATEGE